LKLLSSAETSRTLGLETSFIKLNLVTSANKIYGFDRDWRHKP